MEKWKVIPGFERYEISPNGDVRSNTSHGKGRLLKHKLRGRAVKYPTVGLYSDSTHRRLVPVHRMVLLAFVGECPEGMEARHLDGVSSHCHLTNLVWGTPLENWQDRKQHGRGATGEKNGRSVLTSTLVQELRTRTWKYGEQVQVAKQLGISPSTLSATLRGKTWKS